MCFTLSTTILSGFDPYETISLVLVAEKDLKENQCPAKYTFCCVRRNQPYLFMLSVVARTDPDMKIVCMCAEKS